MKIEVNLNKKYFSLILGSILLLASAFVVYAYAGVGLGTPATFGHSGGEVDVNYNQDLSSIQSAVDDLNQRLSALESVVPDNPVVDPFISKSRQVMEFEDFLDQSGYSEPNHPGVLRLYGDSLVSKNVFALHAQDNFIASALIKAHKSSRMQFGLVDGDYQMYAFVFSGDNGIIKIYADNSEIGTVSNPTQYHSKWTKYRIQREGSEVVYYINDNEVGRTSELGTRATYSITVKGQGSTTSSVTGAFVDYVGLIISDLQREDLVCNTQLSFAVPPPAFTTLTSNPSAAIPNYAPVTIPSACTGVKGCVLKREISKSSGVVKIEYITLVKNVDNKWRVNSQTTLKTNGDLTSSWLFSDYKENIRFRDDSSTETNPNQWSFYDNSGTYMQKIYLCNSN